MKPPPVLAAEAPIPRDTLSAKVLGHDILRKATFTGERVSPTALFGPTLPAAQEGSERGFPNSR